MKILVYAADSLELVDTVKFRREWAKTYRVFVEKALMPM